MATADHARVRQLLPWYLSGKLGDVERGQVDVHVANCTRCAQELEQLRELEDVLHRRDAESWEPSEERFERIVSGLESGPLRLVREPGGSSRISFGRRFAIGSLLVASGLAFLLFRAAPAPEMYGSLPAPAAATSPRSARIQVVFGDDVSELARSELLFAANAVIESGPSARGVYQLALRDPGEIASALETLRADPRVRLAEALGPTSER